MASSSDDEDQIEPQDINIASKDLLSPFKDWLLAHPEIKKMYSWREVPRKKPVVVRKFFCRISARRGTTGVEKILLCSRPKTPKKILGDR
uniref:Uncharacterized protein n=1 Tax=Romanomermis culicivorax TaxID=13658 RepID=A0A915J2N2_ROMCU